jgi:hypothetical protein
MQHDKKFNFNWRFLKYYKTRGYLAQVDPKRREAVIYLPNENITFISDVSDYVNIEKVEPGRIYDLSFSVYMGILDQRLRDLLVKKLEEPYLSEKPYTRKYYLSQLRPIENLFKNVDVIFRFELLQVSNGYYSEILRKRFEQFLFEPPASLTGFKWRHLLRL